MEAWTAGTLRITAADEEELLIPPEVMRHRGARNGVWDVASEVTNRRRDSSEADDSEDDDQSFSDLHAAVERNSARGSASSLGGLADDVQSMQLGSTATTRLESRGSVSARQGSDRGSARASSRRGAGSASSSSRRR